MEVGSYPKRSETIRKKINIQNGKISIMYGKEKLSKIKETICNVPIELVEISKVLLRPSDSNELIIGKLKRDLKYRGYVYFVSSII